MSMGGKFQSNCLALREQDRRIPHATPRRAAGLCFQTATNSGRRFVLFDGRRVRLVDPDRPEISTFRSCRDLSRQGAHPILDLVVKNAAVRFLHCPVGAQDRIRLRTNNAFRHRLGPTGQTLVVEGDLPSNNRRTAKAPHVPWLWPNHIISGGRSNNSNRHLGSFLLPNSSVSASIETEGNGIESACKFRTSRREIGPDGEVGPCSISWRTVLRRREFRIGWGAATHHFKSLLY